MSGKGDADGFEGMVGVGEGLRVGKTTIVTVEVDVIIGEDMDIDEDELIDNIEVFELGRGIADDDDNDVDVDVVGVGLVCIVCMTVDTDKGGKESVDTDEAVDIGSLTVLAGEVAPP